MLTTLGMNAIERSTIQPSTPFAAQTGLSVTVNEEKAVRLTQRLILLHSCRITTSIMSHGWRGGVELLIPRLQTIVLWHEACFLYRKVRNTVRIEDIYLGFGSLPREIVGLGTMGVSTNTLALPFGALHRCASSDPPFLFLMQTPIPPESLGGGSFDVGE